MGRKTDDWSREDEDLVMRDDDHGLHRDERRRRRTPDRDRDVAERIEREQMRGRSDFMDTDFRARGTPGDLDNIGRAGFGDEEPFYSGSVRDPGEGLDGYEAEASEDVDLDSLRGGRDEFFRDEEEDIAGLDGGGGNRQWSRSGRRGEHRRDPRNNR